MNIPKVDSDDYTLIVAVALVIAIGFGSIYGANAGWFDWTVTRIECPYGETIVVINGQMTCVPK